MQVRLLGENDISSWLALSKTYDSYILDVTDNLDLWYEGFNEYMTSKIEKKEALIVSDESTKHCEGIIAFSRKNNRITFFAIDSTYNYNEVAKVLLENAIKNLDSSKDIFVHFTNSKSEQLQRDQKFFYESGFCFSRELFLNGCPMIELKKQCNN